MVEKKIWIRFFSIAIFVLTWIVLGVLKYTNEEISLRIPLIISIILSIISAIAFFGDNIYKSFKTTEDKIPNAITEKEIEKVIEIQVDKMWNHLLRIEEVRSKTVNKNLIYACKLNLYHDEKFKNKSEDSCWMIINANYPEMKPTILSPNTSDYQIEKSMNWKSQSPFDDPNIVEVEETIDPFGKPIRKTKETIQQEKNKVEKEEVVS